MFFYESSFKRFCMLLNDFVYYVNIPLVRKEWFSSFPTTHFVTIMMVNKTIRAEVSNTLGPSVRKWLSQSQNNNPSCFSYVDIWTEHLANIDEPFWTDLSDHFLAPRYL